MNIKTVLLFGVAAGILGSVNAVASAALVGKLGEEDISYIVLFGIAGLAIASGVIAARISNRPMAGLWVGLLVGVVASVIATTSRIGYTIAFYDFVRNDPAELRGWLHRGSASFANYLIEDRMGGFLYTTLFLALVCGICGMVGGLITKARNLRHAG
jgi:hypothetical protein